MLNKVNAKACYEAIAMLEEAAQKHPERAKAIAEKVRDFKMRMRQAYTRYVNEAADYESMAQCTYYDSDGEGKVDYLKYEYASRDELAEDLDLMFEQHQIYSDYDCTGQWFISSIRYSHMRDNIYLVRVHWRVDV